MLVVNIELWPFGDPREDPGNWHDRQHRRRHTDPGRLSRAPALAPPAGRVRAAPWRASPASDSSPGTCPSGPSAASLLTETVSRFDAV